MCLHHHPLVNEGAGRFAEYPTRALRWLRDVQQGRVVAHAAFGSGVLVGQAAELLHQLLGQVGFGGRPGRVAAYRQLQAKVMIAAAQNKFAPCHPPPAPLALTLGHCWGLVDPDWRGPAGAWPMGVSPEMAVAKRG